MLNGRTITALAAFAIPTSATAAGQSASQWLALSLLYEDNATIVTAPCDGAQPAGKQEAPASPVPPTATDQPPPSPVGCPPPKTPRRPGIYVGIAVAAAGGIGAAVALGGGKRSNSAP